MLSCTLPGEPQPWRRVRLGKGVMFVDSRTRAWQDAIAAAFIEQNPGCAPTQAPVALSVRFCFTAPRRLRTRGRASAIAGETLVAAKRPDMDNLVKSVLDGLSGVAYLDDAQVVNLWCSKRYSLAPRTEIEVVPLMDDTEAFASAADAERLYPRSE